MALSRMADHVGRVLGGRYRLLSPLGAGASAQVYLADDVRLRRRVAVKILHAGLSDDRSFLRRFRAEAQAAGALNHPHIVAVYDWNDDDGAPYLVTEYLSGGSLRAILDAGHRLTASQALVVGLEAARALDHAHRQGFVHRDIKPANLIFGDDARLRIADFGLARALAEAGITEPQGAVLGTARYASPEQARGETVDGRSDVYSLALMLVESVSGTVPFSADTTIGMLMARLEAPMAVPAELGPLKPLLEAAGTVDPADRWDAATLGRALITAAEGLPRPAPLPLLEPAPVPDAGSLPDPSDDGGAAAAHSPGRASGAPAPHAGAGTAEPDDASELPSPSRVLGTLPGQGTDVGLDDPTGVVPIVPPPPPAPGTSSADSTDTFPSPLVTSGDALPPGHPSGDGAVAPPEVSPLASAGRAPRRWPMVLAVVAALALGAVLAVLVQQSSVPSHEVPGGLVGRPYSELNEYVGEFGWRIEVQEERRDGTEPGEILATHPSAGEGLREGDVLQVVRSLGPSLVDVPPDLVGMTRDEAEEALTEARLVPEFEERHDDEAPRGEVIEVAGDVGDQAPRNSTVTLVVSSGPEGIPDVIGMTYDEARDQLEDLGLEVERETERGDGEPGEVIEVDPEVGDEFESGDEVTLTVVGEGGRDRIPDVEGMSLDEARESLEDAGFNPSSVIGPGGDDAEVRGTLPRVGSRQEEGTSVLIFTG